ncbi:unnamed protein product [Boreogadus saida]
MDTVPSPIADAGLARNGHPPPLHSPIEDDLQPHLSHSHNNSSSTVSSLLEEVGVSPPVTAVLSRCASHRLPSWQTDTLRPAVAMTPQGALDSPSSPKHK